MDNTKATIISSIISAIIAITVVIIKELFEKNKEKKVKYDTFKKYAIPIIFSSEQLAWRLKEILEFKGAYLLPNAPLNGFFRYKFDSTVYRLNALLGWLQAAQKEQSYIEGTKVKHNEKIKLSIQNFQCKLADGSHVEVSILDDLSNLFLLNLNNLEDDERAKIGVELENLIFEYIPDNIKKAVDNLSIEKQLEMLQKILDFICIKTNQSKIKKEIIEEKRATAINEIAREFCWIYRDWQSAIGDQMIIEILDANRRFDVIGFSKFQEIHSNNIWLEKSDSLFSDLDVSINDRFDSRVQQLKQVFDATINLISTFKDIIHKQESISDASFETLKAFNFKINDNKIKEKKKNFWKKTTAANNTQGTAA